MSKKSKTKLTTSGRKPGAFKGMVNTPIYQTSTLVFEKLEAYEKAASGQSRDKSYGIWGSETHRALETALCELEGANHCLLQPSGLASVTLALSALLAEGDHVLMPDSVYYPTRRFCDKELKKYGVETTYYDPLIGEGIAKLIKKNTKLIWLESPGSLTFEVQDVPAIVKVAKKHGVLTGLDNSWATPLYFHPLKHGVDISMQALTKYVGGHSDAMMGALLFSEEKLFQRVCNTQRNTGHYVSAHDVYAMLKGLRTMEARLSQHQQSAIEIARWLEAQPRVKKVIYPPLISDEGHRLWKRDFTGANGLLSFILDKDYANDAVYRFVDKMKYFAIGASWGGFESLILRFDTRHRTATKWPHKGTLIRIHVGLEDVEDLKADLEAAFSRL